MAVRNNPTIFRMLYAPRENDHMKRRVVRPGDAAVLEGFPRSANTFASYAFLLSQGEDVRFGNHFHSPAQFALARRYGVPAMLVIREPVSACLSFLIFDGKMSPREGLERYIAFHRPLVAIQDAFVTATFEQVTGDFGACIDCLNDRFGTQFLPFEHTNEAARRVVERIAADRAKRAETLGDAFRNPLRTTTPTPEKEARKAKLEQQFADAALRSLIEEANGLHARLTGG
ncbi:MAG: hypothetical protein V7664_04440 [Qipengyuania sp.]|uniref:hypothetical protein n=1 Tax=Qipengyuania sp. TaxID=2004515 RepID=UPI0030029D3A